MRIFTDRVCPFRRDPGAVHRFVHPKRFNDLIRTDVRAADLRLAKGDSSLYNISDLMYGQMRLVRVLSKSSHNGGEGSR